jgi:hypothetical protein
MRSSSKNIAGLFVGGLILGAIGFAVTAPTQDAPARHLAGSNEAARRIITDLNSRIPGNKAFTLDAKLSSGKPLQVKGTAEDNESVAEFVQALHEDPNFSQVRLVYANLVGHKRHAVDFMVQMQVAGDGQGSAAS